MKFALEKNFCFMSTFRTPVVLPNAGFEISHQNQMCIIGSCFAEHIGQRMSEARFRSLANPFGIVYNPHAIADTLRRCWAGAPAFEAHDLFENEGVWRSWLHHSRFAQPDKAATLQGLNDGLQAAHQHLHLTDRLLITLGTSDVFVLRENGRIVANNHKMPAALFEHKRLKTNEIADDMTGILQNMKEHNAALQVVLTVSPVRHLRQGAVENQRSKAHLILACEMLVQALPFVHYFPAYELLMDELRDYRFYAADMLHPSDVAVEFIWQKFTETFCSDHTKALLGKINKLNAAAAHRPFNPDTPAHQRFLEKMKEMEAELNMFF